MSECLCLSAYLPICLSTSLPLYLSTSTSLPLPLYLSTSLPLPLPLYLPASLPLPLYLCRCACFSASLPLCLCVSVSLPVCVRGMFLRHHAGTAGVVKASAAGLPRHAAAGSSPGGPSRFAVAEPRLLEACPSTTCSVEAQNCYNNRVQRLPPAHASRSKNWATKHKINEKIEDFFLIKM